jgi:D-3-phosphoglycerate dehydrogenase
VNFPETVLPRAEGYRVTAANLNVPNMVGQISTLLAEANLNIIDLLNKSRGEIAYTVVDVEAPVPEATLDAIAGINGVLNVRTF